MDSNFLQGDNSKSRHSNGKNLSKHRLYEHFRQEEVESVVSPDLILQMNDWWIAKLKSKMQNFLVYHSAKSEAVNERCSLK